MWLVIAWGIIAMGKKIKPFKNFPVTEMQQHASIQPDDGQLQ